MSTDKPVHRVEVQSMLGDIQEALGKGFHIQSVLVTPSGSYKILGLNVGLSWNRLREKTTGPFAADTAPVETTAGMKLLEFTQARFYFEVVAGNGLEQLTFTVWHRHLNYPDGTTVGPWLRGKSYSNILAFSEVLDLAHYHREVYLQATVYTPNGSVGTAVRIWAAGAEALQDPAFLDVKVDAGDIEVHIEAIPDDAGEKADSAIVAGTTDGMVPTAAGGAPTKTYALRVYPDGRGMPYLQEQILQAAVSEVETMDEAIDRLDRISSRLDFGTMPLLLGHRSPPTALITTAPLWSRARQLPAIGNPQGLPMDLRMLMLMGFRKVVGTDAGAVGTPHPDTTHVTFTGIYLTGIVDRLYDITTGSEHQVTTVVDPAGGVVGTLTITPPLGATTDTVLIPYRSYPHFGNSAVDAVQTLAVAAPPKSDNGPTVLLSSAALAEVGGSYDIDVPVANYDQITVQVYIDAAAGDTYQIDLYARIDDQAAGDWNIVNTHFTASGATALGAAADPCALIACVTTRRLFRELRIRRTKVNNNGNAVARVWIMEGR